MCEEIHHTPTGRKQENMSTLMERLELQLEERETLTDFDKLCFEQEAALEFSERIGVTPDLSTFVTASRETVQGYFTFPDACIDWEKNVKKHTWTFRFNGRRVRNARHLRKLLNRWCVGLN